MECWYLLAVLSVVVADLTCSIISMRVTMGEALFTGFPSCVECDKCIPPLSSTVSPWKRQVRFWKDNELRTFSAAGVSSKNSSHNQTNILHTAHLHRIRLLRFALCALGRPANMGLWLKLLVRHIPCKRPYGVVSGRSRGLHGMRKVSSCQSVTGIFCHLFRQTFLEENRPWLQCTVHCSAVY